MFPSDVFCLSFEAEIWAQLLCYDKINKADGTRVKRVYYKKIS